MADLFEQHTDFTNNCQKSVENDPSANCHHDHENTAGHSSAESRCVEKGCVVVMDFVVRLLTGKIVDSSDKTGGPASFVCGSGDFPRPVEEGILGMRPGDTKTITVHPYYAYGMYDPKKQVLVAAERIAGPVELGKVIKVPDQLGITRPAVIRDIWPGAIMVDFNHPLAGQALNFEITIREVKQVEQD